MFCVGSRPVLILFPNCVVSVSFSADKRMRGRLGSVVTSIPLNFLTMDTHTVG